MRILIKTLGDAKHGLGHVKRCLTLARELRRRNVDVVFTTPDNTPGHKIISDAQLPIREEAGAAHALIIDVQHGPDRETLACAREHYPTVINIGGVGWAMQDPDALNELVDLQIYQSVLVDAPAHPRRLMGVEYVMINPEYATLMPDYERGWVVISMGGSDPHNLTGEAVKATNGIGRDVIDILGPAINTTAPKSLRAFLRGASLSVIQLGMTAYESLAAGVPPLLVNLSPDHERTSVELERRGCAINLGLWNEFDPAALRDRVAWLVARPSELERMGKIGRGLVDGRGVLRVADRIMEAIK